MTSHHDSISRQQDGPAPSQATLLFQPAHYLHQRPDETVSFFLGRRETARKDGQDIIMELNTSGGDADAARRIALEVRLFRRHSSQLALERSGDATKALAKQMFTDHEKTTADLKGVMTSGKVKATLPTAMTHKQQSSLNDLKALQINDFTKQYRSDQVGAHADTDDLFKRYSEDCEQASMKAWAGATLPPLQHHLAMANELISRPAWSRRQADSAGPCAADRLGKTRIALSRSQPWQDCSFDKC